MNKTKINNLRLANVFMTAVINGILGSVWNRYYNENLSYTWLQLQMLSVFVVQIIVSHMCETIKNRKLIFIYHIWLAILSMIIDLGTIICFQISHNPFILLLGDTLVFISFTVDDVALVEIDSALLHGNERSLYAHKRDKIRSIGALISYGISLLLGILVIKDVEVSSTLLTITQYVNWVISFIMFFPLVYIWKNSKSLVYKMWTEGEN